MSWVEVRKNPPQSGCTLFVSSGSTLFFAARSRWQDKWFHLHNGTETECTEPEFWWDDDPNVGEKEVVPQTKGQLNLDL